MLESLIFNGKTIPIPIPLKNLSDAVGWAEETLLPAGFSITRICVDGFEVDLLVEVSNTIFPIEFKLSSTITSQHTSSLKAWLKLAGQRSSGGLIVSTSVQMGLVGNDVHNCHFSLL